MLRSGDKIVYDGWLKVRHREIGSRSYDILYDFDAVAAIITNEMNEVLLVRQFRPALLEETVEIPAGVLDDPAEAPIDCLIREVFEETELRLEPQSLQLAVSYKPNVGFSNARLYLYHAKIRNNGLPSWPVKDQDVFESMWAPLDLLGEKVKSGEIVDVKTIVAYYFVKTQLLGDSFLPL